MTYWPRISTLFITLKTSLLFTLCERFPTHTVSTLYGTHHVSFSLNIYSSNKISYPVSLVQSLCYVLDFFLALHLSIFYNYHFI